jgi:RNA polymerase sigma-70 factor (ECF subfamily)
MMMLAFFTLPEPLLDRRAIEALYRSHGGLVLRRARSMLGNATDAADAVQNIFANLLQRPESFQGRSRATTFLYAVTTNHCLSVLRDRGNRQRIIDDKVKPDLPRTQAPTADVHAELRSLLARLPEQVAQTAIYYYFDELTQDQIAEILGCSRRRVAELLEECATLARTIDAGRPSTTKEAQHGRP